MVSRMANDSCNAPSQNEAVHVDAEDQLGLGAVGHLEPGLGGGVGGNEEEDSAVLRYGAPLPGEAHGETEAGARGAGLLTQGGSPPEE